MIRVGVAGYHCALKMVDDCIGMIVDKLTELRQMENTLIIYTSDHGEMLGEHGLFNKAATCYDAEVRIPFMIRFPDGYKAGESVKTLSSSLDFVPTLLDILGLASNVALPGHSLVPSIERGDPVRNYVTLTCAGGAMGIRTTEYKMWYSPQLKDGEMYRLKDDPQEMNNLFNNREEIELRSELFELMLHARIVDDIRDNKPTERETLLREEVRASYEPQVNN
jgi:arylsulfatase A-like enzyme